MYDSYSAVARACRLWFVITCRSSGPYIGPPMVIFGIMNNVAAPSYSNSWLRHSGRKKLPNNERTIKLFDDSGCEKFLFQTGRRACVNTCEKYF